MRSQGPAGTTRQALQPKEQRISCEFIYDQRFGLGTTERL